MQNPGSDAGVFVRGDKIERHSTNCIKGCVTHLARRRAKDVKAGFAKSLSDLILTIPLRAPNRGWIQKFPGSEDCASIAAVELRTCDGSNLRLPTLLRLYLAILDPHGR
jgi:hypothetical protein